MSTAEERFQAHQGLIGSVIARRFASVLGSPRIDIDDLRQEGALALWEAALAFDPAHTSKARFQTYAWHRIYWKLKGYVANEICLVSLAGFKTDRKHDVQGAVDCLVRALSCRVFSEIELDGGFVNTLAGREPDVDLSDVETHCWEKIQEKFDHDGLAVLLKRFSGDSFSQLGEYLGVSREWARKIVGGLVQNLEMFVRDEVEGGGDARRVGAEDG